ncbi:MAG: iron ABC transporter permease [Methanothrix sp.]|nr:iron ABC transporter permease [Methanothrix sp.]
MVAGRSKYRNLIYFFILISPFLAAGLSLFIGRYPIDPVDLFHIIISNLTGTEVRYPTAYRTVIFEVRLPRIILGLLVGASLSAAGATFQGIFRNPLVSPYILGISSGAAFGAALSIAIVPQFPVQISALLFSLIAVGFAYYIASSRGSTPVISLILSGVIVSAIFDSMLSIIQIAVNERALQSIVYWLMGSLGAASWSRVNSALPLAAAGMMIIFLLRWRLNVLALGDEEARGVGMNTDLYKALFVLAAALAASAVVSVVGIIGFVGLVVPHMIRMLFGPDHTHLIPLCMAFGATFMVLVDDIARAGMGFEVPVGVITTLIGAPFFAYLLRSTRSGGWE